MNHRQCAKPDPCESDGEDDDMGRGDTWRKQQRDMIKKGSTKACCSRPKTGDVSLGSGMLKAPQELPPLKQKPVGNRPANDIVVKEEAELVAKRVRSDAQAQASACWEDVISFLELHKLPGAYALAFSAYGVEDLSSLLLLDDAALSSLLARCNIDAMDEILLLEALRSTRAFH